jgi:hypothetical protein
MLDLIDKSKSEQAPPFEGIDSSGRNIKLSSYLSKSNVVLVLNRGFG